MDSLNLEASPPPQETKLLEEEFEVDPEELFEKRPERVGLDMCVRGAQGA